MAKETTVAALETGEQMTAFLRKDHARKEKQHNLKSRRH